LDEDEDKENKKIAEQGLETLETIYGDRVPPIDDVKYIVQQWEEDPYTLGSFTHFRKGAEPSDFDALAEPLKNNDGNNKVFFAGEATIRNLFSTVNGAYVSGIREAEKIQREDEILDHFEQQQEYGVHPASIVCRSEEHLLVLKSVTYEPICVTKATMEQLTTARMILNNTWAIMPEDFPFGELEDASNSK
jgi:hypothetical protein